MIRCAARPWVPLLLTVLAVSAACQGDPTSRDLSDTTAPTLTLAASGTSGTSGFVDVVGGSTHQLVRGTALTLSATASDDGGVAFVEIWFVESHTCFNSDGTASVGQGLGGSPLVRTDGAVTATEAPKSVTTGGNVPTNALQPNCSYDYEVFAKGANAASAAVEESTRVAHFTLDVV
jgi:hypothetical protein